LLAPNQKQFDGLDEGRGVTPRVLELHRRTWRERERERRSRAEERVRETATETQLQNVESGESARAQNSPQEIMISVGETRRTRQFESFKSACLRMRRLRCSERERAREREREAEGG
jgi:hypothetical protein